MSNYYLDIETTGIDPKKDKIISIQFQKLFDKTSQPMGELRILKEWESNEKKIVEQFIDESGITDQNLFTFIPVGYSLTFEHNFLLEKSRKYKLPVIDVLSRPFLDLKVCGVIMNNGYFKGSGLDRITGKPHDGSVIPEWYSKKEYEKIENYIEVEAQEFVRFCMWLYKELPGCLERFKENNDINK